MDKFGVELSLEAVAQAKKEWATAITKFNADVEFVMTRLIHEAARNRMSAEQIAKASGLTAKRVRLLMRNSGLDPRQGKLLLSKIAAEHLQDNAALMGVAPHEVDLMSPLAYLPMGRELRDVLETSERPTELPDEYRFAEELSEQVAEEDRVWCVGCGFLESAEDVSGGECAACGCSDDVHLPVSVVLKRVNGVPE